MTPSLFDFRSLGGYQFEMLCGALLAAEGNTCIIPLGEPGEPSYGLDWVFQTPSRERWVVQVKHTRGRSLPNSSLRRAITDLKYGITSFEGASRGLLMVSSTLSEPAKEEFAHQGNVVVWDALTLSDLLDRHAAVRTAVAGMVGAQRNLELLVPSTSPLDSPTSEFEVRLSQINPGRSHWRSYETFCIDLLTYVFSPALRPPRIQTTTKDGLDRRDAIYPIGMGSAFWDNIKYQHAARMVVAEFKNLTKEVGQVEVESLAQYLMPNALRSFGLLCSRRGPSTSATTARRRAWMEDRRLILFLSDANLLELARIRAEEGDPCEVLDAEMDEFFIHLAP